jgi:hypothetical protein
MAFTDVQIANMALHEIGHTDRIAALTDTDHVSETCNFWYATKRDQVLEAADWPFARRTAVLALVTGEPADHDTTWQFAYDYPNDCLKARFLVTDPSGGTRVPYEIGGDDTGKIIYTNEAEAYLVYTARVTDPTFYPATFAGALAFALAEALAPALAESAELATRAGQKLAQSIRLADRKEQDEQHRTRPHASWIRAR